MSEFYEYFLSIHPEMIHEIANTVELSIYEMYIKLKNGTEYIYDVDTDSFNEVTFSYALRVKMKQKHLTQSQLANRIGVYSGTIGDFISGKRIPDHVVLKNMATALNCSIEELHCKPIN